jgi:NAD(P)-dependent dehydrogenase (short-subunit alcohol dehydrogenase family)
MAFVRLLLSRTRRIGGRLRPVVNRRLRFTDRTSTSALTRPEQVRSGVNSSVGRFGRIDVLVNNARYGFTGAFEEMTEDEFKGQIDTNCWDAGFKTKRGPVRNLLW